MPLHRARAPLAGSIRRHVLGRPPAALLAGGLVLTAFVLIISGRILWNLREEGRRAAWQSANNLALSLEHDISQTVGNYELSLRSTIRTLQIPEVAALTPAMQDVVLFDRSTAADAFAVTDAEGRVLHDSGGTIARDIGAVAPDLLALHRQRHDGSLVVGKPVRAATSGRPVVTLSIPVLGADGQVQGIAAGAIYVDVFRVLFDALELDPDAAIALSSSEGWLILRRPFRDGDPGRSVATNPVFRQALQEPVGMSEIVSRIDGTRRLYAFRHVGNGPLLLFVGLPTAQIDAAIARKAWAVLGMLAGFLAFAFALGCALVRALRLRSEAKAETGRAQEALRESEARFRRYFEGLADGIVVLRRAPSGRLVCAELNEAAQRMIGAAAAAVIGKEPSAIWPSPEGRQLELATEAYAADGRRLAHLELHGNPVGYPHLRVALAAMPLDGRPAREVLMSLRDVTELNRLEEGLRRAHRLEAVGQLASGIAHDFNNLLQVQMGSLELLLRRVTDDPTARRHAETALRMGERGASLTRRLLAFSRKQILLPAPIDLGERLASVAELLEPAIGPQVNILTRVTPDTPHVFADQARLEDAILNLALNARDAMPEGGTLTIEATPAAPGALRPGALAGDGFVVISLTDTGRGMSEAELAQACEPFFTTKGPQGSGLGLSMVLGFARQSGGELAIASARDRGTRVEIWLPCAENRPEPPHPPALRGAAEASARVLLVDSELELLTTMQDLLNADGLRVRCAPSAEAALAAVTSAEPLDLLVTDLRLGETSGLDLIRQARRIRPGLVAVLMTRHVVEDPAIEEAGVPVLRKPFGAAALLDILARLDGWRVTATAPLEASVG